MNNLSMALTIKTQFDSALKDVKTFKAELQHISIENKQLNNSSKQASQEVKKFSKNVDEAAKKTTAAAKGLRSISTQLANVQKWGTRFIGLNYSLDGLSKLFKTADAYNNYQARINLVSRSNTKAKETFKSLMTIANETGKVFSAVAELYTRVYRSLGDSANSKDVLAFTKTVQQALTVSGASSQESQAALIQLSQGLSSGALRGEEFNSVAEQAPVILEILQKSLNKTRAELRKMAEEGKLTTAVILAAVRENAQYIEEQYEKMPKTIERSINELSNAWLQFIGETDDWASASNAISSAISVLANNLNGLGQVLMLVAGISLIRFVSNITLVKSSLNALALAKLKLQGVTLAQTVLDVKAAKSAAVMAAATDREAAAVARLTLAQQRLNVLQTAGGAGSLAKIGGGISALLGGQIGIAVTAITGLVFAFQYLKSQQQEIDAQFKESISTLEKNIEKTKELVEVRRELANFSERKKQLNANNDNLAEVEAKLKALKEKRQQQQTALNNVPVSNRFATDTLAHNYKKQIKELDVQIAELSKKYNVLKEDTKALSDITESQLKTAFENAKEAGGALTEKLANISDANAEEAIKLLTPVIVYAEKQMLSMNNELDETIKKLGNELTDATTTSEQRLTAMANKFAQLAKEAGLSSKVVDDFISKQNEMLDLQKQLKQVEKDKKNKSFLDNLRKRAENAGLTRGQRIVKEAQERGLTGDDLAKARRYAAQLDKSKSRGRRTSNKKEYDAESKNLALNIQYLRLTGQEVKANLTDIESRYNKLLAEFQKAGNVDGINLIKKVLPLEQTKVKVAGIQAEINKLFQHQSAEEQRIQSQVQTGLITHLEGQRQLKDVYAQTVAEIEKQLPLLEKLAQMPGVQGEQARAMLDKMKLKITELKTAGNDLEKSFKDGLTSGIQSSLMGLAQGTMTLKDAVKNLALTVINSMAQIAAQQLAMQATSFIGGFFGAGAGTVAAATGGYIRGAGTSTSDSIPARLSDGEFVVRAAAVSHYGVDFLHALNRGYLRKFSQGGLVSTPTLPTRNEPSLTSEMKNGTAQQAVASPVNIQQTLAVDSAELFTAGINTVAGERAVMTVIRANKQTLKQELDS
ncbi:tape measure protein [Phocoenobacter skyensis]|uniref:Tape measure protein n=1 Tax=Phocoenobacter skyensis TaxID=97481 RepID=A0ABT9JKQ1_9PAST|nr:tape measure protein [Pasteurella skyensis]MDP8079515.1 tape measure protein [Pasteurella skyensis]MDP8085387.1 tape measure protein [Pasteurella skyensis]